MGLPVQDKFQLYVYEKGGLALLMVTQLQGITPQPVGYLSKELDQVAKRWPGYLTAVAAVSLLVPEAQKLPPNCLYFTQSRRNFKLKRRTFGRDRNNFKNLSEPKSCITSIRGRGKS
jgi:hypothetical protein